MLKLIPILLNALKAGEELKDSSRYKKWQDNVNSCAIIITALVAAGRYQFGEFPISDEDIIDIASLLAICLGLVNRYLTVATTKTLKMGVIHGQITVSSKTDSSGN